MTWADDDDRWAGAPPDEDFETLLAVDTEDYPSSLPHVPTLLGPIPPEVLGVTLFTDRWPHPDQAPAETLADLESAYALGVRSVAFLGVAAASERRDDLGWIAARSPLHLVALADDKRSPQIAVVRFPGAMRERSDETFLVAVADSPDDYQPVAEWIAARWRDGAADRLLAGFALDPVGLMERLPLALMAAGMPAVAVRGIFIENPARCLTVQPAGATGE